MSAFAEKVNAFHQEFLDLIRGEKVAWTEQYPKLKELRGEFDKRSSEFRQFQLSVTAAAFLELIAERMAERAPSVRRFSEAEEGGSHSDHPIEVDSYHCPHCRALVGGGWGHENLEGEDSPAWKGRFGIIARCPECNEKLTINGDILVRPLAAIYRRMDWEDLNHGGDL